MRIKADVYTVLTLRRVYITSYPQANSVGQSLLAPPVYGEANPGTDRLNNASEAKQLSELGLEPRLGGSRVCAASHGHTDGGIGARHWRGSLRTKLGEGGKEILRAFVIWP